MDDDNYVNVRALLRLLASYPHTQDVYIGKPSLDRPIQATERLGEDQVPSGPAFRRARPAVGGEGLQSQQPGLMTPSLPPSDPSTSGLPLEVLASASAGGWP